MAALGWVPADHLLSSGPCRAWQLFDWVRLLPACDELRRFCHSSTYVTMIALCGTWRQLRRALELVADMRSRDMECGLPVRALHSWMPAVCDRPGMDVTAEVRYCQMQQAWGWLQI